MFVCYFRLFKSTVGCSFWGTTIKMKVFSQSGCVWSLPVGFASLLSNEVLLNGVVIIQPHFLTLKNSPQLFFM